MNKKNQNLSKIQLRQTNRLIHSKISSVKPIVYKLFLAGIALHKEGKWPYVCISNSELKKVLQINESTNKGFMSKVRKVSKELMTLNFEIKNENGDYEYYSAVSKIRVSNNQTEIYFDDSIRNDVSAIDIESHSYSDILLYYCSKLTSFSAIRLYQVFFSNHWKKEKLKSKRFAVLSEFSEVNKSNKIDGDCEYLGSILGYSNKKSYQSFSNVRQRILEPAIKEINAHTNVKIIDFDLEYTQSTRRVIFITFNFMIDLTLEKQLYLPSPEEDDFDKMVNYLVNQLVILEFTTTAARKFIKAQSPLIVARCIFKVKNLEILENIMSKIIEASVFTDNLIPLTPEGETKNTSKFNPSLEVLKPLLALEGLSLSYSVLFYDDYLDICKIKNSTPSTFDFYKWFLSSKTIVHSSSDIDLRKTSSTNNKTSMSNNIDQEPYRNDKDRRKAINRSIRDISNTDW